MFRCENCRSLSESADVVPESCTISDCNYIPKKIKTLHYLYYEGKRRLVACTGKPLKSGGIGLGVKQGVNCLRCLNSEAYNPETEEPDEDETPEEELPESES